MGFGGFGGSVGLVLKAATPLTGFTLVNGTPNIITWTVPNDGKMHRAIIIMVKHITTLEVGGAIQVAYNIPDGSGNSHTPYAGGEATATLDEEQEFILLQPGTTVIVQQSSALTSGASKIWAEIWGL